MREEVRQLLDLENQIDALKEQRNRIIDRHSNRLNLAQHDVFEDALLHRKRRPYLEAVNHYYERRVLARTWADYDEYTRHLE